MARDEKRPAAGRATPKSNRPAGATSAKKVAAATTSGRYTPPIPREQKVSPWWVPALMFTLLGVGALMILLNYLGVLLPGVSEGDPNNAYLLGGLGLILAGIITATQYH
jgi:Cell division protein CrgA